MIDPTRAAFVSANYRYETLTDNSVKTKYPNARSYSLDTALDATSAANLASDIKADSDGLSLGFELVIEQALMLEDFDLEIPRYLIESNYQTAGKTFKVMSASIDYVADTTTLTVRAV